MPIEVRFYVGDYASIGPFVLDRGISVGRGTESDLPLPDNGLSRRHCQIEPRDDGASIRDLGSTNGTFFNGATVQEAHVPIGGEFWVGHTRVLVATAGMAAQPLPGAGQPPAVLGGPTPPPRAALPAAAAENTFAMSGPLPGAEAALAATRAPFTAQGAAAATPQSSGKVAKTLAPFAAPASLGGDDSGVVVVAKTQAPFRAPTDDPPGSDSSAAVAKTQAPFRPPTDPSSQLPRIRVFVDGKPHPVKSLELHYATNEAGQRFLQIVVNHEDDEPGGEIWLAGS